MPIIAQHRWRWCSQCQGLWYSGATQNPNGACPGTHPAGGPHSHASSGDYALFDETQPAGFPANVMAQQNWHWCSQCGGLWIATSASPKGFCPKPGTNGHTEAGSGNYTLLNEP
jgi:hypothetical protein